MSRALGAGARGEVATVLQIAYFLTPLLLLGADRRLLRRDWVKEDFVPSHVLVTAVAAGLVLAPFLSGAGWYALPVALFGAWMAIQRSLALRFSRATRYVALVFGSQAVLLCGAIVLYVVGVSEPVLWLLPYVIPAAFVLVTVTSKWVVSGRGVNFGRLWGAVQLRLVIAPMASMVTLRAERLMLPALHGPFEMGLYVAIATATEPVQWLAQAVADETVRNNDGKSRGALHRVSELLRVTIIFAGLAAAAAMVTLFVVIPLLGPDFRAAGELVLPLSIASVALALYRHLQAWLLGYGHGGLSSLAEVAAAVVALPVYYVGVARYGALGAAWSAVVVYALAGVVATVLLAAVGRRAKFRRSGSNS